LTQVGKKFGRGERGDELMVMLTHRGFGGIQEWGVILGGREETDLN